MKPLLLHSRLNQNPTESQVTKVQQYTGPACEARENTTMTDALSEAQFQQLADDLYMQIEDALDECNVDIDCEAAGSVLTLLCEDTDTQVIVSRQPVSKEIWVAARSGGFHCAYQEEGFVCSTTQETLQALLDRVLTEQSDSKVTLGL